MVIAALLVAFGTADVIGGAIVPPLVGAPYYLNPVILLALILYGVTGLATVFRTEDRGWPWFASLVGLWIFTVAVFDSLLQWFIFQVGIATSGGRVDPLQVAACMVALAATVMLHMGQLARRTRDGFAGRGLDPRELVELERRVDGEARGVVLRMVALTSAAGVVLFVAGIVLGRANLGIGALGILGGLVIITVISAMAFGALRRGPVPGLEDLGSAPLESLDEPPGRIPASRARPAR